MQRTFTTRAAVDGRILSAFKAGPYILGEHFCGADILIASMGQVTRAMLPADPLADAYLSRCTSRPALARAAAKDAG
jgi:glutathione S-transferase